MMRLVMRAIGWVIGGFAAGLGVRYLVPYFDSQLLHIHKTWQL